MADYSFIANAHPTFIESMYAKYMNDPMSVEENWRTFFKGFEYHNYADEAGENGSSNGATSNGAPALSAEVFQNELKVFSVIKGFRNRGHLAATTNPIRDRRDRRPHLDLADYGLSDKDLDTTFQAGSEIGLKNATLREIVEKLKAIYCGNIGFEYHQIESRAKRRWLRERIEQRELSGGLGLSLEKKKRILEKLNDAVNFEKFLHTKYVGQKRFSLEGGESTIPAIDAIINAGAEKGVKETIIGMAHRGRLNVLANIMGKTYEHIFNEFEGAAVPDQSFGDGDVKYHLGYSSQTPTPSGKTVDLKLVPNPSHLESVDPVVEGFARAKADILYGSDYDQILPILIHGDAAVAGQGVVYETVQFSQLPGYHTGGTIHYVINNQVGFTTDFEDARSSTYSTAAASLVQAPVFHVNGDDPEAVVFAAELALEYRQEFNNDVFIDMVCYRKHGHNEGDDPKFTQPEMYKFIKTHKDPREIYVETLTARGDVDQSMAEKMETEFWGSMQDRLENVRQKPLPYTYQEPELAWKKLKKITADKDYEKSPDTGIDKKTIKKVIDHLMTLPESFTPLSKVNRLLKGAQKVLDTGKLDWALAELLAYGSILLEGKDVRMSGQDVKRGTFSHRHAIFRDGKNFSELNRLDNIDTKQGKYRIFNSLLSEFAVLGFEYGYSLATPDALVLWEAQFGDFYNGAQVMVDQYIMAAESKWQRQSGLIMLLPHGYAGQGPEHSSARLERFLQGCAENNVTVANITSPANLFHSFRRQLERPFRKPLIIMSPKSLLRHPEVVSDMKDFEKGSRFQEVLDDSTFKTAASAKKVKRLILCTGKVYFDLLKKQREDKRTDVAIVRIEQLYPLPAKQLDAIFKKYKGAEVVWAQEEPANMGAWQHMIFNYCQSVPMKLVARKTSASPATGFKKRHDEEQKSVIDRAFAK